MSHNALNNSFKEVIRGKFRIRRQVPLVILAIGRAAGLLLKYGSPKNHPNEVNGMTPISVSVAHSAFDCVRLLAEDHGADPAVADFEGESALRLAASHHDAESLRILVENYTSSRKGDSSELTRALERAIATRNK